jgi:hypothetical protein
VRHCHLAGIPVPVVVEAVLRKHVANVLRDHLAPISTCPNREHAADRKIPAATKNRAKTVRLDQIIAATMVSVMALREVTNSRPKKSNCSTPETLKSAREFRKQTKRVWAAVAHPANCLSTAPSGRLFSQRFKTVELFKLVQKHGNFLVPDSPVVSTGRDFAVFIGYAASR